METFAEKVIDFYSDIRYTGKLPEGVRIMNPFQENLLALSLASNFYKKFYSDNQERTIIIGINPGRHGAAVTGIPFTDTKRLKEKCNIDYEGKETYEPSSVFVHEVIEAFGGLEKFCKNFYITSICPLGFVINTGNGKEVNYNYYDNKSLTVAVYDFITTSLEKQLDFGINREVCFCLGAGKNEKFLRELNMAKGYFKKIIPLEHPRYIVQYKTKFKDEYIKKYLEELEKVVI
jgi:hypothetical protein